MIIVTMAAEGPSLLLIEAAATAICMAGALFIPRGPLSGWKRVGLALKSLSRKRSLCIGLVGISALMLRLMILPFSPVPKPFSPPDFSFLLAADTFASGRLTNPVHPMWPHFESLHITVTPTYMSMYFPAQGMVLAAGKVIAGNAWFGLLAINALMCAALCWMLQAWLPPEWALLGASLAVLRIALFSYWIDSYTGGSVGALGGALVMGALPRIWRNFRSRDFFWLALGAGILALSRPYEGLLLCVPAFAVLGWKIRQADHPAVSAIFCRSVPGLLLLIGTLVFMGYYNHRVFGSVFTLPYTVNREMYASAPHFLWQKVRHEPVYRHKEMREFYSKFELASFLEARTWAGFARATILKIVAAQLFFLGTVLLVPMTMLPFAIRDKRIRILVVIAAIFACGLAAETWLLPHYMAPLTAVLYVILLQCMRHMRIWRIDGRRIGVFMVRAIPAICVLLCIVRLYALPLNLALSGVGRAWPGSRPFGMERDRVLSDLENQPGKHLAIVRYAPDHDFFVEWVWNSADIDGSKVVWSRDMCADENAEIIRYFPNRKVWLVEPDVVPPKVSRYVQGVDSGQNCSPGTPPG